MYDSKSGSEFLQRVGLIRTLRRPLSRIEPKALAGHTVPLEAPLPLVEFTRNQDGDPEPPDRGVTQSWPPSNS